MRVLVFGDSIAYGAWDSEGGWVERLKRDYHKQFVTSAGEQKVQVLNLGIGGDGSVKILRRLKNEIEARKSSSWPFVFIFFFCTNDERAADGVVETPVDTFRHNVHEIIAIAQNYTDKILFCGVPPLGATSVMFKGVEYHDGRVQTYEAAMREVAEGAGISFVELRSAFEARKSEGLHSFDNLHPNDTGHELICQLVKPALAKLLQ